MKKLFYFLLLPVFMALVNCTNESEEYSSLDEQVQKRISLVTEMAKDYGLDNFKVDVEKVRANIHMPIEDIEREMRALSMLKGTYYIESEGNGNYRVGRKVVSPRKRRSAVEPLPNDIVHADIKGINHQGDSITINYSFHIEFGTIYITTQVSDASFEAVFKTKDSSGNTIEQPLTGTIKVTIDRLTGFYPSYTVFFTVEIDCSAGKIEFTGEMNIEDNGETIQNTVNYGVIQ